MKRLRLPLALLLALAMVGAGLPSRALSAAFQANPADGKVPAASEVGDAVASVASEDCDACGDKAPCPDSRPDCSAQCAIAASALAVLGSSASLLATIVRDRCGTDCRLAAGRAPPPDPFPPRT